MSKRTTLRDRRAALLVALLVGVAPLVLALAGPATAGSAPQRWAGYVIPSDGHAADGGWIGGYVVGGRPAFVTTPGKALHRRGYRSVRVVGDLGGRRGPTRGQTARAAWILSKYGGYRDATQAAAVDVSVYDLVAGGRWRTTGARGARRIREAPQSSTVRRFARIMLDQSRRHAGAYQARVTATNADAGGTVSATVKVTDGHHRPAPGLPVRIVASGTRTIDAVTGDNGKAVARFAEVSAGWKTVTATVRNAPEHRLHLRAAVRRSQATVAEGGVRRTLVARTRAAVRGPQTLALAARPATIVTASPARVTATVTGDGTSRQATGTLYGPFDSTSAARCTGHAVGSGRTTVKGDGAYTLPPVTPADPGYYVWKVAVDGTPTALPVTGCGAVTTVKAVPQVSVTALQPEMSAGNAPVRVSLSGLPRYPALTATLNVRGPYASQAAMNAAGCSATPTTSVDQKMNGDATVTLNPYVDAVGWYSLQATVPPDDLRQGGQSTCLALGTVLHVS